MLREINRDSIQNQHGKRYVLRPPFHNEHAEDGIGDWNNQELNLQGRTKPSVKGHKIKGGLLPMGGNCDILITPFLFYIFSVENVGLYEERENKVEFTEVKIFLSSFWMEISWK